MLKKFSCAMVIALALVMAVGSLPANAGGSVSDAPGDLLLGYLYDVRQAPERDAGWENFMVIQNTTNAWVAAHLRFRSYQNSIEVWDHIILLSPNDVFWMSLTRNASGGLHLYSMDTHTLLNSGLIESGTEYSATVSTQLLSDCGYTSDLAAASEMGEFEVIGLWRINNTSHNINNVVTPALTDLNGDGAINALDILRKVWPDPDNKERPASPAPLVDCTNSLVGSMELGDIVTGQYKLYNLASMMDFRTDSSAAYHRDGYASGVILYPDSLLFGRNYYATEAEPAFYYHPDWATTTGATLRDGDSLVYDHDGTPNAEGLCVVAGGLDPFNAAWSMLTVEKRFYVDNVYGFFMEGAFNSNIMTDAVLAFPTKYLHYLHHKVGKSCSKLASGEQWPSWEGSGGVGPYNDSVIKYRKAIKSQWDAVANGPVLLETFDIWDTEQNKPQAISGPSPHPVFDVRIPAEVNVLNVVNDIFAPVFQGADEDPFDAGQFQLGGFAFNAQQRDYRALSTDSNYASQMAGAVLGATIRIHEMEGSSIFRSTMAPLHGDSHWDSHWPSDGDSE